MATDGGGSRPISLSSEPFYDFPCSNCAKDEKHTEGESFCVECNEIFCTSCLVFHNKIAAMRQHELLDQTKMATRRPSQDVLQLSTARCTVHTDQVINLYCGQHDIVCCTVCIAEDHRSCKGVIYIPKKAKNIKTSQEFQDVNAAIDTMRADIDMLKKGKKLDIDRITAQHAQSRASIVKLRKQINKHLDHLEASISDELDKKFKIYEKNINKMIAQLDFQLLEMEKRAVNMRDAQNESQVFVEMKEAKIKLKESREFTENVNKSVGKAAIHFVSNQDLSKILKTNSFGIFDDQKTYTSVSCHGDFNVKTLNDKTTCTVTGSCQMLDGNMLITDIENEKLKLLDQSYKVITECKLPGRPMKVCRTSPTKVAISMARNKMVLFADVTDKISLKTSFNVGEKCRGIAYNAGLLYVACGGHKEDNEGPGQVRVYDRTGKLIQTFMKDKHKKKLLSFPYDFVVSECKTKLQIVDWNNGIVTMNLDGTEPWKITSPNIKEPTGICGVNNDDLIVCGCVSENVILFDKSGQQKAILLKKEDGIEMPHSVLYDRLNSRLIVSIQHSNHIKVYNLL